MSENIFVNSAVTVSYFVSRFAFGIGKDTMLEMNCVSAFSTLSVVISFFAWCVLFFLKKTHSPPAVAPISFRNQIVLSVVQVLLFIIQSYSSWISQSIDQLSILFAIPCGLLFYYVYYKHFPSGALLFTVLLFTVGSVFINIGVRIDSYKFYVFSSVVSLIKTALVYQIESTISQSGCSTIDFLFSFSAMKLIVSVFFSGMIISYHSPSTFFIRPHLFNIILISLISIADLISNLSMVSIITKMSAISFLITEEFCHVLLVLIGNTLNPTKYSTLKDTILSFLGFMFVIPGYIMFFSLLECNSIKRSDTEPFRISSTEKVSSDDND